MKNFLRRFIKICPKTGEFKGLRPLKGLSRFLLPFLGLIALVWILIRVIPKPSRAQYPCIKAATPIAISFVTYIIGSSAAIFSFKTGKYFFRKSQYTLASFLFFIGIAAGLFTILKTDVDSYAALELADSLFVPTDPPNTPIGIGKGIFPGRVIWIHDSTATNWNGTSGQWWNDANINQTVVDTMLSKSLRELTGKSTDAAAWDTLFRYFNSQHGRGNIGYQAGEKIAIKINLNQCNGTGNPGNASFTSPQTVLALLRQLVNKAGVQDANITFYDLIRFVPDPIYTKCKNEFPNVHFMSWTGSSGREKYLRDTTRIYWSENLTLEINGGHPTYIPTSVTQATYLINLANFKGHRYGGVSFCAKNHFGTLSCDDNTGKPYVYAPHAAGVHPYIAVHDIIISGSPEWTFYGRPMGTYNALVDLMGHKDLGSKTLLFMVDALYGVQDEQHQVSSESKWLSAPFNNDWTSSLFLSQDNVAIESVGLDFYRTEQSIDTNIVCVYGAVDNYLHEAAQADEPPSGTVYDPENDGIPLQSLGVHEHWNKAVEKKYEGINLVCLQNSVTSVNEHTKPSEFILYQNYPNPFNPSTKISFSLPAQSFVFLKIFDINGREVATIISEELSAGIYSRQWDAKGFSSGVYFYRLQAGSLIEMKKLLLLK